MFRLRTLALVSLLAGAGRAQPTGGLIAGLVVDAVTNTPVRRASVSLSTVEQRPQDALAWTDAQGRFAFGYLPPGRYQVHASKESYQQAFFGSDAPGRPAATLTISGGEVRTDIVIRLRHTGTISGTVLNGDGDPMPDNAVELLAPQFERGKSMLSMRGNAMTDAGGHYHFDNLAPGRYAVAAGRAQTSPAPKAESVVSARQPQLWYVSVPQFYPGVDRSSSATLIPLTAGKEVTGIDFRILQRPAASLRGKVLLPEETNRNSDVTIFVYDEDGGNFSQSTRAFGPGFDFRLDNLTPRAYTVVAQALIQGRQYRGIQHVDLTSQRETDLSMAVEPGIDLLGTVTVEGPDAGKHPAGFVGLSPGDAVRLNSQPPRANVGKDGSFKLSNVAPGVWDISAGPVPPGGYMKSMRLGDRDVLTEDMMISPDTDAKLKIVIGTLGASLEGDLDQPEDRKGRAWVVVAPDGKYRNVQSFRASMMTDEKGHFAFKGLTPGTYRLYAFAQSSRSLMQDPEALKPFLERGVAVELKEGQNAPAKLKTIENDPEM